MIIDELFEGPQLCPECGGISFSDLILAEKKDACYYKVKASAKVWPSAYASGRLVQCRKKGAANYGNKSESVAEGKKKSDTYHIVNKDGKPASLASYADKESAVKDRDAKHQGAEVRQLGPRGKVKSVAEEQELDEKWSQKYKSSINCANPRGFSQKAHCAGRNKNEDVEEGEQQKGADYRDPKEVDYDDEYDAMVARVKKLAGLGPMKTVYDPTKRQYRNMPTAVQPKK